MYLCALSSSRRWCILYLNTKSAPYSLNFSRLLKYHLTIYWLFSQWPVFGQKNMHFRLSVRCLLGVWWVSGWCQGPSGLCLRCINAKSIGKGLVDIILNKYRIFSQWPIFGQKRLQQGVSGGCLEGVWRVSWAPWIRSGYIYAQWIEKKLHRYNYYYLSLYPPVA